MISTILGSYRSNIFFLMIRRPPVSTRTDTLFPYTTLFRSQAGLASGHVQGALDQEESRDRRRRSGRPRLRRHSRAQRRQGGRVRSQQRNRRSEEHTSELQSLMRISYAVFCLKKKTTRTTTQRRTVTKYSQLPPRSNARRTP